MASTISREPSSISSHGYLIPIGGAEDKLTQRLILNRFVRLCGGSAARIVVIPAASAVALESAERYCKIFTELGASSVNFLNIESRKQANDSACVHTIDDITGVFMTGGDQVKLVSLLGGTAFAS